MSTLIASGDLGSAKKKVDVASARRVGTNFLSRILITSDFVPNEEALCVDVEIFVDGEKFFPTQHVRLFASADLNFLGSPIQLNPMQKIQIRANGPISYAVFFSS